MGDFAGRLMTYATPPRSSLSGGRKWVHSFVEDEGSVDLLTVDLEGGFGIHVEEFEQLG
jgi:hypothetical protein